MIRIATINDLDAIWNLRLKTTDLLKSRSIDQWQYIEPSKKQFMSDIENHTFFVSEFQNKIIGMMYIMTDIEHTYDVIDGQWRYDFPYITIHRLAVDQAYLNQGIAFKMLDFGVQYAIEHHISVIRIDTHKDNIQAQHLFEKQGFKLCGTIMLSPSIQGERKRLAYDLRIGESS
ncbi:MAG: GNAT family N-acetyltransferase [Acholeplasmataceae bacterium]